MKNAKNIELRKLLLKIGISSNIKGFHYILEIVNILEKQKIHTNITTIYEMLGKKFNSTPSSVERAMRSSISKAYKGNDILKEIYSNIPDNSVFLYDLVFNFDIFENIIKEK